MNVFQVINPESIVRGWQLLINIGLISRTSINLPFLKFTFDNSEYRVSLFSNSNENETFDRIFLVLISCLKYLTD